MKYRKLGKAGIKVSEIALGSWRTFGAEVDDKQTEACLKAAYENGVNFFDGAEGYGLGRAEEVMGRVFSKMGWPRDSLVVSSKVGYIGAGPNQRGLSRKHVVEACEAALRRFGFDYLDLYFCHGLDDDTPVEETVSAMDMLVRQGKVLYWGTSNHKAANVMEKFLAAERLGAIPPNMEQILYNMIYHDRVQVDFKKVVERQGYGLTVWSPLAIGILTGKYNDGIPADSFLGRLPKDKQDTDYLRGPRLEMVWKLGKLAVELGIPQAHLSLAWCLKNPAVSTLITGASRPEQVLENVKACEAVDLLTADVMKRIDDILAMDTLPQV